MAKRGKIQDIMNVATVLGNSITAIIGWFSTHRQNKQPPGKTIIEDRLKEIDSKFGDYDEKLEEQAEVIKGLAEQDNRLVDVLGTLERKVNILIWASIFVSILAIVAILIAVFK